MTFEGYQYVASSSDMQSDYILDDNRLSPAAHMNQGFPQSGETVGEYSIVAPKDNKVYYIAAVIGVIAVAVIAFGVLMVSVDMFHRSMTTLQQCDNVCRSSSYISNCHVKIKCRDSLIHCLCMSILYVHVS